MVTMELDSVLLCDMVSESPGVEVALQPANIKDKLRIIHTLLHVGPASISNIHPSERLTFFVNGSLTHGGYKRRELSFLDEFVELVKNSMTDRTSIREYNGVARFINEFGDFGDDLIFGFFMIGRNRKVKGSIEE